MRYGLKRKDASIVDGVGWNKKAHAEHWIQEHIKIFGGLDWRVGGMFKAKNDDRLEVVWSKSGKSVNWLNVLPEDPNEQDQWQEGSQMKNCKDCRHPVEHHARWCVHSGGNGKESEMTKDKERIAELLKVHYWAWICTGCGFPNDEKEEKKTGICDGCGMFHQLNSSEKDQRQEGERNDKG